MSPLWSDMALARAALADAAARGLIEDREHPARQLREREAAAGEAKTKPRHLPRSRLSSLALWRR